MTPEYFCTGRRQGHARPAGVLKTLLRRRGWPTHAARAAQVHGTRVVVVPRLSRERRFANADGLLTAVPEQPLAIFTADCVPLFLWSPGARVVGVLHAGWRGVQSQILRRAVGLIRKRWGASDVEAWAGPSIGPCCFEVHWDVASHFPFSRRRRGTRWTVNLVAELRQQARRLGLRWRRGRSIEACTAHARRYFSYRRNKTEERQVSVIQMCDE